MSLQRKENNLRKAQARLDRIQNPPRWKVISHLRNREFQIDYRREPNRHGKYRTRAYIVRGAKSYHGNSRGLIHKTVNLKYRVKGDAPSVTRLINSYEPTTKKGKLLKKTAQVGNFAVHDVTQTAVDTALAAETVGLKASDIARCEARNKLKQKYTREAVDDYHRGIFFMGKTAVDAVKGTHQHFKQKKQHKLEKAKFKLKKADNAVFKAKTYQPKLKANKVDLKSAKAEYKSKIVKAKGNHLRKAMDKRCKQAFQQSKRELKFERKQLKVDKKFKKKELKNQRKISKNTRSGFLILKPATYTAGRMKASAWQKAVNEDSNNDMLHALDSTKRRIAEPVIQKVSKPERLQRQQKKRDSLADKEKNKKRHLNKQESKLKTKNKQPPKKRKKSKLKKSFSEKFKDLGKLLKQFIKNVYEREVKKFFACVAVPIIIILLIFALILMIFSSTGSGGSFTLGTYAAQDYDLSEAEKYYTKLAWDLNEKVIRCGGDDWKNALKDLGADTSGYNDKPDEYIWGRSVYFDYDAVYDFDVYKLWSFLCAYYYDFDAENGDIKYWKFKSDTEDLLDEIFNAEYEFEHFYDNTSRWEEYDSYYFSGGIDGTYWLADSANMYNNCYLTKSNPGELNGFKDDNGYLHFNENLEILNAQDDYKRTGWFIQDQRYFVNDRSGQSSAPFYSWFNDTEFGRVYGEDYHPRSYWGFSDTDQIYWCVSPQDTLYWRNDLTDTCLINYYQANYWETDCQLYYNVKQKKTFDEVIADKLGEMSHSDERLQYYNLLAGNEDGNKMYGNHQTIYNLLPEPSIRDYSLKREFGYEMTGWNESSDGLYQGIKVYADNGTELKMPFKGKITEVNTDENKITIRKDDVEYWYDGTGGTKRDTEIEITNAALLSGFSEGDTVDQSVHFAKTTAENVNFHIYIDTDGYGWDYIDPRLVLY